MSTSTSQVAVMDQYASGDTLPRVIPALTPLAHVSESMKKSDSVSSGTATAASNATAQTSGEARHASAALVETPVTGLLILRAKDAADQLSAALQTEWSVTLPTQLQAAISADGSLCIRWMSPDEWLLSCALSDTFEVERGLRKALEGHIAVVNVSGGYSVLRLSGVQAQNVLRKSTAYDVSPVNFPAGKVVNTVLGKSQVMLRAVEQDSYEILVRRSFADYLLLWLQRAGREYDMKLVMAV